MHITTEKDISGQVAKQLREQAGLTQKEFWTSLGLTQSGGSRYENENALPKPVRILVFAVYVAGLRIDASTGKGVDHLKRLSLLQASDDAADKEKVGASMLEVQKLIKKASRTLNSITV